MAERMRRLRGEYPRNVDDGGNDREDETEAEVRHSRVAMRRRRRSQNHDEHVTGKDPIPR